MVDAKGSTPCLIGDSIRNINDENSLDFQYSNQFKEEDESLRLLSPQTSSNHALSKMQKDDDIRDRSYTSVAELNREGALLTDEVDLENVDASKIRSSRDDLEAEEKRKKLLLLKRKQRNKSIVSDSFSSPSLRASKSTSLITSTDPVEDHISKYSSSGTPVNIATNGGEEDEDIIRNSYGQMIKNNSNRPHLAKGESYQSAQQETDHLAPEKLEKRQERSGRSFDRQTSSTEFLRSLSRSISRDPIKNKTVLPADEEDSRMYSTSNYSISLVDLENKPKTITETLEEEQEDAEREGVLMEDEGNEEYPRDLEEAANKVEQS
ncbi:hypothetical protein SUVZ_12G2910 [Saccharomyces uvarum]|uniref:YLR257W-like protein n=1 Tax=Saccharomyces uvarum TaxID=230603 RepID=A0ABN8WH50_SACUV|nr:hypothetical protein SUVZ_12G2910 [Saccharomyces uvarum]